MTGSIVRGEAQEGRMGLQLTQAEGYWLFPLVGQSLFAGDLESPFGSGTSPGWY